MEGENNYMSNWAKIIWGLLIAALLLVTPFTRQIILIILPLGSGIDDLLFFVFLTLALLVFLIKANAGLLHKIREWIHK